MWKTPLIKPQTHGDTCPGGWFLGNYSLGFERSVVRVKGERYLGRWILYVGGFTLRLHRFFKGDDARAPHDHPWSFWTFPLCDGYAELVPAPDGTLMGRWVRGWRWNYRPSSYQHIVADPPQPFYTVVVSGRKDRSWGFWPAISWAEAMRTPGTLFWAHVKVFRKFVPWREWK